MCNKEMGIIKTLPIVITKIEKNLINFKCPICNEGKSWGSKSRAFYICKGDKGYIYCHNCHYKNSLMGFVYDLLPEEYGRYKREMDDLVIDSFLIEDREIDREFEIEYKTPSFQPIFDNREAVEYVERRKIDIDVYRKWYSDEKSVIIPLLNDRYEMFAYQHRFIVNHKLRYKTIMLNRNYKKLYNFYNKRYKSDDKVYICEGIFDSASIESIGLNSIAVLGASIPYEVLNITDNIVIILDSDKTGMKKMIELSKKYRDIKFIIMPNEDKKLDVNSYLIKYGKDRLREFIDKNEIDSYQLEIEYELIIN